MKFLLLALFVAIEVSAVNYINESFSVETGGIPSRLAKQRNTIIKGKAFERKLNVSSNWFAEVFFRPIAPQKNIRQKVHLMTLTIGSNEIVMRLSNWKLQLLRNNIKIADFPAYQLFDYSGMTANELWNYLLVSYTENKICFYFNGYPIFQDKSKNFLGPLTKITVGGKIATSFADLRISEGNIGGPTEVRKRYLQLYQGKIPIVPTKPVISAPLLPENITLEDIFTGKYQNNMSSIPLVSLSHLAPDYCDAGNISALIGYNNKNLFLRIETSYHGKLAASSWNRKDAPIWNEEAWEWFLRPENHTFQLLGNPYGNLCDLKDRNIIWDSKASYLARIEPNRWIAAWAIPLADPNQPTLDKENLLYRPQSGAIWKMNLFNTKALKGWNRKFPYFDHHGFGTLRFDDKAPAIRLVKMVAKNRKFQSTVEFTGASKSTYVVITAAIRRYGEIIPETISKTVQIEAGKLVSCQLEHPVKQVPFTVDITITHQGKVIFNRSGHLPGRSDLQRVPK